MKNTLKRILFCLVMLGITIACFSQEDCMSFQIDEVSLQEEGLYVVHFTVINLSEQSADWIAFEYPPFTFFGPSLIQLELPAKGGVYSGSFELWDLHFDPLMPGDVLFFKAIIENKEGWCCHMDGIPIKIPGEEPVCACEGVEAAVEAGFHVDFSCELSSQILLTPKAAILCDSLIWTVYDYEKNNVLASDTSLGLDTATLFLPSEIGFWVEMRLIRWDENGNKCESNISLSYGEEVINCCVTNLSPIVLLLKKTPKTGNAVQVNWMVQAETNFEFFTIIRYSSQDTVILDRVKANLGKLTYNYTDLSPPPGTVKYFVVGTAKNLDQVYSRTKSITGRDKPAPGPIVLFPNPAGPKINIRMPEQGPFQVSIWDWNGRKLMTRSIFSPGRGSVITLDVAHLSPGIYLLQQRMEDGTVQVIKWIKK